LGKRTWIKIYCDKWVGGTIREEPPAVRGIFIDLLALAGSGNYGEVGQIKLANEVGLPDTTLQKLLRLTEDEWVPAKDRLVATDRITVTGDNIITIVNWDKYQSEYQRLREYTTKGTPESTAESTSLDKRVESRDKRLEKETKAKKDDKKPYGEFQNVLLTDAEYQRLQLRFGDELTNKIENLSAGIASKGYKYRSHYAAILNWDRRDEKDAKGKGGRPKVPARDGYSGAENLG